jgi:hypothetical protein
MPLVQSQVTSQIKVRDLSRAMVSVQPAEASSWSSARADLIVEAKRPLKVSEMPNTSSRFETLSPSRLLVFSPFSILTFLLKQAQLAADLAACNNDEESAVMRGNYEAAERELEHQIDHKPLEANLELEICYQFLSK